MSTSPNKKLFSIMGTPHAQNWIAFGMLMISLIGIAVGGLVAFVQVRDKLDTTDQKATSTEMRMSKVEPLVYQIAGRMGIDASRTAASESVNERKENGSWESWEESVFVSSTEPACPLCWYDCAPSSPDSDFGMFQPMLESSQVSLPITSKPSPAGCDLVKLFRPPPLGPSGSMFLTRVRW